MDSMFQQKEDQSKQPQPTQSATPAATPAAPAPAAPAQPAAGSMDSMFDKKEQAEKPPATTTGTPLASANEDNSEAGKELASKQSAAKHGLLARAWDWVNEPILDNILPEGVKTADIIKGAAFEKLYNEAYIPGVNDFNTKAATHFEPAEKALSALGPKEKDGAIKRNIRKFLVDHASSLDVAANATNTGIAGAARDTADMGAGFTSPLSLGTLGLGKAGRVGKVLAPLVGTAFGLQGLVQGGEGAQKLARTTTWESMYPGQGSLLERLTPGSGKNIIPYLDPEASQEVLGGTGQAALAGASSLHAVGEGVKGLGEKARPVMKTVGGQEVPVRAKGTVAEAIQKGVNPEVNQAATAKTQAAVQEGVGNVVGEGVGSEASTKIANQDRLGIRSHAADLKEAATDAMDELNRLSNGDYEDAKSMMDKSKRDFTVKGREDFSTAQALHDDIVEQHRDAMKNAGFDVDEMKANYRKSIALEKIASRMDTATGPLEGGKGYEVKGERLAKVIDDMRRVPGNENPSLSKNLFERAGLTEDHINALADLADTLRDQQEIPKFGSLTKLAAKAISIAATTHVAGASGLSGLFEGLAGEKAGEVVGSKVMTKLFGEALTSEPLAKELNAKLKGGVAALSTWDKFQQTAARLWRDEHGEMEIPGTGKMGNVGKSVQPINETPMEDMKVSKRDNGDWEFNHPNGTSQMVLHPEADTRPGYEGKTQLRQTGISAVDAPGAGQQMMDDAVARMKKLDNVSRIVSDHPDLRSPENEGHWSKLARRGHEVQTEPAPDSFGQEGDGKVYSVPNNKEFKTLNPDLINPEGHGVGVWKQVGDAEYSNAVKSNEQAVTLTSPEDMAGNRKFSNGKGVYYSISPKGDLQGVVNNSGQKGALAKLMPEAIANGAKTLDAWDLFLPKQYEKYGFKRTNLAPYDVAAYGEPSADLKAAWEKQGWKPGEPYPGVQYMKLASDAGSSEIATRRPTSKTVDVTNAPGQHADMAGVEAASKAQPGGPGKLGYADKLARTIAKYSGIDFSEEDLQSPKKVMEKFINHMTDNLVSLHDAMPEPMRQLARQWYDTANTMAKQMAQKHGVTPEQSAGVLAALSPQNAWDNNVALADRLIDTYKNRQSFEYSPKMEAQAAKIKQGQLSRAAQGILKDIHGKTLAEIDAQPMPEKFAKKWAGEADQKWANIKKSQQAMWVRLYDEAHNSPQNPMFHPNGDVVGMSPNNRSWIGLDHLAKSLRILDNGSVDNINAVMGDGNKIRNFYNNIINPDSPNGHTTIDTHAVGAAHFQPFSGDDAEVQHNFGNSPKGIAGAPKHALTGMRGTYPLYAEAYRRAAQRLGLQPRELQSITWEGIRSLMGDEKKTPELKAYARETWEQVQNKELTPQQAREKIIEKAGGFSKPSWMTDEQWDEAMGTGFNPEEFK